jgi:hypothetical protein
MIYQALMFISLVRRKKSETEKEEKKPIDRWGSLVVAIVNDGGFLFVKWQPSLFIRFVSFVSWTRSNECFKVSLEKTLPNEIQLNRDDDTQLHSSCGLYICIYTYTHTYMYLCIHCITITELNLSNIAKRKRWCTARPISVASIFFCNLQIYINNHDKYVTFLFVYIRFSYLSRWWIPSSSSSSFFLLDSSIISILTVWRLFISWCVSGCTVLVMDKAFVWSRRSVLSINYQGKKRFTDGQID